MYNKKTHSYVFKYSSFRTIGVVETQLNNNNGHTRTHTPAYTSNTCKYDKYPFFNV